MPKGLPAKTKPEAPKEKLPEGSTGELYVESPGGVPLKIKTSEVEDYAKHGYGLITKDEAEVRAGAQQDLRNVDTSEALGLGLASGLTAGIGPGLAVKAGLLDPHRVMAAQTSDAYTAGDVAGLVLPAIATGGAAVEGRAGMAGSVLRYTPAGLVNEAGGLAERMAASMLGENMGALGKIARPAIGMAGRGAAEGALVSMGNTLGDSMVQNKPLAIESIAASGLEGGLFGGLLGGGLGFAGGLGHAAADGVVGAVEKGVGGKAGQGVLARRFGMSAEDVANAPSLKEALKGRGQVILDGGGKIGDKTEAIVEKYIPNARKTYEAAIKDVVSTLEKDAASKVPNIQRVSGALDVLPEAEANAARKQLYKLPGDFPVEPVMAPIKEPIHPGEPPVRPMQGDLSKPGAMDRHLKAMADHGTALADYERALEEHGIAKAKYDNTVKAHTGDKMAWEEQARAYSQRNGTWSEWVDIAKNLKGDARNIVLSEIRMAAGDVDKALAEKFGSAWTMRELADSMAKDMGNKAANELLKSSPGLHPRDAATAGAIFVTGHPVSAAGYLAMKAAGKRLDRIVEPWMSQMAWNSQFGTKAVGAEQAVKTRIRESIGNFFRKTTRKAVAAGAAGYGEKNLGMGNPDKARTTFEERVARARTLASSSHQERVRRYADMIAQQGYTDLAKQIVLLNQRTANYVNFNLPQSTFSNMGLRKPPKIHGLDANEHKQNRLLDIISKPMKLLSNLEEGTVSPDEVKALKSVYPEIHKEIVMTSMEAISTMKSNGEYLPVDKISQLGIVLDYPVDSILEPEFINEIQAVLNTPPPPSPDQGPAPSPMQSAPPVGQGQAGQNLLTPAQQASLV